MARVVVFSGPIAAGKTTVAFLLQERHGVRICRTSDLLRTSLGAAAARGDLQRAGAELDDRTAGRWVADALAQFVLEEGIGETDDVVILDSARRQEQIDALREAFGSRLIHVHITAAPDKLAANYRRRRRRGDAADYPAVVADPIEAAVGHLAPEADLVIDRGRMRPEDAAVKVAARLGLFGSHLSRLVDVVVGGGSTAAKARDTLRRTWRPNTSYSFASAAPTPAIASSQTQGHTSIISCHPARASTPGRTF